MSFFYKLKSRLEHSLGTSQFYLIAGVLLTGALLAFIILGLDQKTPDDQELHDEAQAAHDHQHEDMTPEQAKGPHAGKLFAQDDFSLEVTIFEQNVEPQFRLYPYLNGKPLDPGSVKTEIVLQRLGREAETVHFNPESDYLKGDKVISEPHSFAVTIKARYGSRSYSFQYDQIEARVHMTERQLTNNGIEILTAGPARIKTSLQLIGEIKLNADKTVYIVPRLSGIVESVSVNAGDRVKKGQILAIVSSQSLADQRSELLAAQKRLALSRITHEREKKLWEEKISAEQDYLQARNAMLEDEIAVQSAQQKLQVLGGGAASRNNLTRYEIRSPIDGIVTDKQVATGQVVKEDASIFVVADLGSVWVEMTVYAKDINSVKLNQQVTVRSGALNAEATGTVTYVGALVGATSRTATARVVLQNHHAAWRPGVPVDVQLVADEVEVPLAVSVEGLQSLRDWKVVFARYGEAFEARPISTGRSDGRYIEILDGLLPGERYAAQNSFLIKAELGKAGASHDH